MSISHHLSLLLQLSTFLSSLLCTRVGSPVISPFSIPSLQPSGSSCCSPTWLSAVCCSWLQGQCITSHTVLIVCSSHQSSIIFYLVEHKSPVTYWNFLPYATYHRQFWQRSSDWLEMTWVMWQRYITVLQLVLEVTLLYLYFSHQVKPLRVVQSSPMSSWAQRHAGKPVHSGKQLVVPCWRLHAAGIRNNAQSFIHQMC